MPEPLPAKTIAETYPSVMRIFLPMFFAVLAAIGVAGAGYHWLVRVPQLRATSREAAKRLLNAESDQRKYDPVTGLTTTQLEFEIKREDLDSPCNTLTDESFARCASAESRDEQNTIINAAARQPK